METGVGSPRRDPRQPAADQNMGPSSRLALE
jgi:hypothetical protein